MSELETALEYIRDVFLPLAMAEWDAAGFDWRPGKASLECVESEHPDAYIQAVEAEEDARVLVVGGRIYKKNGRTK